MNKRGQFFLIAAFVIAGIILSLSTIYIAIRSPPEETKVYDLSKEINEETAQIITQGTLEGGTFISGRIESLVASYSASYPDTEITAIYGKKGEDPTFATYYQCTDATTQLEISREYTCVKKAPLNLKTTGSASGSTLTVDSQKGTLTAVLKTQPYKFDLPTNEDNYFYIILRTPKSGQQTVATSEP